MNPTMSDLLTNPFCFIFKLSFSIVKLLQSGVVKYLDLMTYILRHILFFTKLLTSGILFLTAVNAAVVAKPVILGILLSISVIFAL